MREGLVGLGHAVCVVLLLDCPALAARGSRELGREPVRHRLVPALTRVLDQPAEGEARTALRPHLDRHLVRRTAYATALHLDEGSGVRPRLAEDLDAGLARALLDRVEGAVDDLLRNA